MILDSNGNILHDIQLPEQGTNGNGKAAPAAPTPMDLNGDGTVEIVVQTFGAGCFVFTILEPVTQFHRNFFTNVCDIVPGIKRRFEALILGKINLLEISRFRLSQLSNKLNNR